MNRDTNEEGRPGQGAPFKNHHDTDEHSSDRTDNGPGPLFAAPVAKTTTAALIERRSRRERITRSDEPVVTSYSVCEQFPNRGVADWEPTTTDEDGEPNYDAWHDLPDEERWSLAMAALRASTGMLELKPDNFDTFHFGIGVSASLVGHDGPRGGGWAYSDSEIRCGYLTRVSGADTLGSMRDA